jgi:hypothetical protein
MRLSAGLVPVFFFVAAVPRASVAQTAAAICDPPCGQGQTCVDGVCMVPSPASAPPQEPEPYRPPVMPPPSPPPAAVKAAPSSGVGGDVPWREGFMALPFIGLNSFQGDTGRNVDVGLRLGAIVGTRLAENWSAGGELVVDFVNPSNTGTADVSEYMIDFAFTPLLHVPQPGFEFVLGPVLGGFVLTASASGGGISESVWAYGWTFGANAGVLLNVNESAKVGLLVSFVGREPFKECASSNIMSEMCATSGFTAAKVLGFAAAAMF